MLKVFITAGSAVVHHVCNSRTSPTPPSYEVGGIAKRIKTARLRRKTNLQKFKFTITNAALLRGRWHRQKDKNRSPSAKNQSSEIQIYVKSDKKVPKCV
nr:MAG TPA: hypothetical protein [Bacteriophage sp.]